MTNNMEQVLFEFVDTPDADKIFYDGNQTGPLYAVTITSRKKISFTNRFMWRDQLYKFLHSIKFKGALVGVMEEHETDRGVHMHGYITKPFKSHNSHSFFFWTKYIDGKSSDIEKYTNYAKKEKKTHEKFNECIFFINNGIKGSDKANAEEAVEATCLSSGLRPVPHK